MGKHREQRLREIHAAHSRYSEQQLQNTKTRKVLEMAFGQEFTELYMEYLLFDVEPLPGTEDDDEDEDAEGFDPDEQEEYDNDGRVFPDGAESDDSWEDEAATQEGVRVEKGVGNARGSGGNEVLRAEAGEKSEVERQQDAAGPGATGNTVEGKERGKKGRFEDQEEGSGA
jgi:hypothetical protein